MYKMQNKINFICLATFALSLHCCAGLSLLETSQAKLIRAFGSSIVKQIELQRSEWLAAKFTLPSFTPTAAQKAWFNSLGTSSSSTKSRTKRSTCTRKEYRQLSDCERERFHKTVKKMKTTFIDGASQYDLFVWLHHPSQARAAHLGAAFLLWHREYLFRFENALQEINPYVSLPYWDSTLDRYLPKPEDSILWTNGFMGDVISGPITRGPFANWRVTSGCRIGGSSILRRDVGDSGNGLITDDLINNALDHKTFQRLASYRFVWGRPFNEFEDAHGGPHVYVGGQMRRLDCSPSDPIFWLHHAFIDLVFEKFREGQTTDPETEYPAHNPPAVNIGSTNHNPDAPMNPFTGLVNRDGLSNHYTRDHCQYNTRPYSCYKDTDCGLYLFCHYRRCKSKVKFGGDCTGLYHNTGRACEHNSRCLLDQSAGHWKCMYPIYDEDDEDDDCPDNYLCGPGIKPV